ncbi:MAG TPA: ABC transporter permease [Clostridia bacterium]|nr:ABC transporter permease [Clostridia bacterium]
MFLHVFVNRFKCLVRDRQLLFWTLLFPIVLATFFHMAFSNLQSSQNFENIKIAVVNDSNYQNNSAFRSALAAVSTDVKPGQSRLFVVTPAAKQRAVDLLKNSKIDGYFQLSGSGKIEVFVKESGINQTILKEFADDYVQTSAAAKTILSKNPAAIQNFTANLSQMDYLKEVSPTKAAPNDILNEFYSLIAMACLYGGFWGIKEVVAVQADLSAQGARVSVAPVHKLKIFSSALCAATAVEFTSAVVLIAYLNFVLKVDFGNQIGYVLLACLAGCFTGVTMGALIGAVIKKGEGIKVALLIFLTMALSFLTGLYGAPSRYTIIKAFPPIAWLNPANVITDAFYSLYYYNTHTRYFTNIGVLFGMSTVFIFIVSVVLRRQKYASL